MNISNVIKKQLEYYEIQMQEAAAMYAEASAAVRAITALTTKLREEVENEANTDERVEKEVISGP